MTRICALLSLAVGMAAVEPRGALAQADAVEVEPRSTNRTSTTADYLADRHAGSWNAISTTYSAAGRVATGRLSYVGTVLGDGRVAVEIALTDGRVVAALLEYVEIPAPGPLPLIQVRQHAIDGPPGDGPQFVSEGAINGLEFRSRLIGAAGGGSRLSVLLDPGTTFTTTVFEDGERSVELSLRDALPPAGGETIIWERAEVIADLLAGSWTVETWELGTGEKHVWTRRTEALPTGELLTSIQPMPSSSDAGPDLNTYYRTVSLTDEGLNLVTASISPWTTVEADAGIVASDDERGLEGTIAPGTIEWRIAEPTGAASDLRWGWYVMGRDLLVRLVRDWDGQWRWCIERRSARSDP